MPIFDIVIFDPAIFDAGGTTGSSSQRIEFDDFLARIRALPDGSIWQAGMFEPGMWDLCVEFNKLLNKVKES